MLTPFDEVAMASALRYAASSLDESRKTSCFLVRDFAMISCGVNQFPPGVLRSHPRTARPAKYAYTEHAERAAIYQAARFGLQTFGCTAYVPWFPCADCARALVCAGVKRLVCYEPDWGEERYNFHDARAILGEGGLVIDFMPGKMAAAR